MPYSASTLCMILLALSIAVLVEVRLVVPQYFMDE